MLLKQGLQIQLILLFTRLLIYGRVLAICAMVGATVGILRPSQRNMPTDLKPGSSKFRQNLPAVAYREKPLGISRCDGRDMPTVASTIVQMTTVGELEANS
jgi:hypothetical protein